ncbi:MAG TPA: UvrD-helicase domain-containing protein, partial [Pirellulales bacterium]|nr:UvrD-helicase domain-containing protein [Pirellulales bacterium]
GFPPEQILATTFARKAAGEILDRIVTRLAEAICEDGKLSALGGHLGCPSLGRENCIALLRTLIGRLHRLQIGTLDSFFVQLAGSFSLELGLPLGWRIVDALDDRRLRRDAIGRVLEGQTTADSVRLVHLLSKGEATRSVTRQIEDVVDNLYELFLETDREAWQKLPRPRALDDTAIRDAMTQIAALDGFADKRFVTARDKNLEAAEARDWDTFIGQGLAKCIVGGQGSYYSKPIEPGVLAAYAPLIEHARSELLTRLANQTEGTWELLDHFHKAYQRLKADQRAMRFDDVTRALAGELTATRVEELAYRLDGPLGHLLLDEFQDTSRLQWEVLRPFAKRVTSNGGSRSFFCVGDAKQAIYGWRGGVAEIFDSAGTELPGIVERSLAESHRSSPVIIDVVNRVFANLPDNASLQDWPAVAAAWHERYDSHTTAKGHLAGHCRLLVAERIDEGEKQEEVTWRFAAEHVAELAHANPNRTIGVLVRRNRGIARLIYELRSGHQVFASEEGGNPLTDSTAVQLILSLLKVADHPGDTAARFHVAKSLLGAALEFTDFADDDCTQRLSQQVRERLATEGYGPAIREWVKALAPSCDLRDLNRLLQLVELAYRFDDGRIRRPDDFIARVEDQRVEDPTAANVRVMTVHQAKGLQFDIVVLPELDLPLKLQSPRVVIDREGPLAPVRTVSRYANETIQKLLPPQIQQMFAEWENPWIGEALCVLYVAMTRAIHSLDLIIAPSKPIEKTWPKTYAGLLRGALAKDKSADPETTLFEVGATDWASNDGAGAGGQRVVDGRPSVSQVGGVRRPAPNDDAAPVAVESIDIKLRLSPRRHRGLGYRTPSGLEGCGKVDLRRRLNLQSAAGMTRGSVLHAWFERISWLEDALPSDDDLIRAAAKFATPEIDLTDEIKRFRAMLGRPAVIAALTKKSYDEPAALGFSRAVCADFESGDVELRLQRERAFTTREENSLVYGKVDRVVYFYRGAKLLAADILDFKTDAVRTPAEIAERADVYRPQLAAYRRAAAALTGLPIERISARLLFVEPGVIERVE